MVSDWIGNTRIATRIDRRQVRAEMARRARLASFRTRCKRVPESLSKEKKRVRDPKRMGTRPRRILNGNEPSTSEREVRLALPLMHVERRKLGASSSLKEAIEILRSRLEVFDIGEPEMSSGIVRLEVVAPKGEGILQWIERIDTSSRDVSKVYFSPRSAPKVSRVTNSGNETIEPMREEFTGARAGVGAVKVWRGDAGQVFDEAVCASIHRFLPDELPDVQVFGGTRFDCKSRPGREWEEFGSYFFLLPIIECKEQPGSILVSCNIVWDRDGDTPIRCDASVGQCIELLDICLRGKTESQLSGCNSSSMDHCPKAGEWEDIILGLLDRLASNDPNSQGVQTELAKVVLARRTMMSAGTEMDPFKVLAALQELDPRAYQFCLQLPSGSAFFGSTPERLFCKTGNKLASESMAGTRPRAQPGNTKADLALAMELMLSPKEHTEFSVVQDAVQNGLESLCEANSVRLEIEKEVVKQAAVQHLYSRLTGKLIPYTSEDSILSTLHPTPAVCGHPREAAREAILELEPFDRGFYAGPFGWIGSRSAEFAVAIRSALLTQNTASNCSDIYLYAGVGIVDSAEPYAEWKELDLKIKQYEIVLGKQCPLPEEPNINSLWARLIVDELCRLGLRYFCIAPGSRSTPLALAVANNPRAIVRTCLDERSLCFHALGFSRGRRQPAVVITTSGTAVANLLPAVVEAHESNIAMLLLTADRPKELLDNGSNQTITQPGIFGANVRYECDLPCATDEIPVRMLLTTVNEAIAQALGASNRPGPVHLNCPFREPLAPVAVKWERRCLEGLARWEANDKPFTKINFGHHMYVNNMEDIISCLRETENGLIVVGQSTDPEVPFAALKLAETLGWPVVADVTSGLRIGQLTGQDVCLIRFADQILLSSEVQQSMRPEVIIQFGGMLVSKRLQHFMEDSSKPTSGSRWIFVGASWERHDPGHLLSDKILVPARGFVQQVSASLGTRLRCWEDCIYSCSWRVLDAAVERQINSSLEWKEELTEAHVANLVSKMLPEGHALFLGNSMPIRDFDMFADPRTHQGLGRTLVASNRGASGIDGVLSTACGYAVGSRTPTTLVVGDTSFLHDVNGLLFLRDVPDQYPVTVIVVNNGGGSIFNFLPVAKEISKDVFETMFVVPTEDVDIGMLCKAHCTYHEKVSCVEDFSRALERSWSMSGHSVMEIEIDKKDNLKFHETMRAAVERASTRALATISRVTLDIPSWSLACPAMRITSATFRRYVLPLKRALTSCADVERVGVVVELKGNLSNADHSRLYSGLGEASPLPGLHEESIAEVEDQLQIVCDKMASGRVEVPMTICLLDGSVGEWLEKQFGDDCQNLMPSVRFGLESALLSLIASIRGVSLGALIAGETIGPSVSYNGLIDTCDVTEAFEKVQSFMSQGLSCIKIKVGRNKNVELDVALIQAIRARAGPSLGLRCDANRSWSLEQALRFGTGVKSCNLDYVEEPCLSHKDSLEFQQISGIPVAFDETLDSLDMQQMRVGTLKRELSKVGTFILKPSKLGGIERTVELFRWAQAWGIRCVVSSCFEGSVGMATLVQIAGALDSISDSKGWHGLGTSFWFAEDLLHDHATRNGSSMEKKSKDRCEEGLSTEEAAHVSSASFPSLNPSFLLDPFVPHDGMERYWMVDTAIARYLMHVREMPPPEASSDLPTLVFLHGFLGSEEDWIPLMRPLSKRYHCISVDLPGHGLTRVLDLQHAASRSGTSGGVQAWDSHEHTQENFDGEILEGPLALEAYSLPRVSEALARLLSYWKDPCVCIGYSMGGRIALHASFHHPEDVLFACAVSASDDLNDPRAKESRVARDRHRANILRSHGLLPFVRSWYASSLWDALRTHPGYEGWIRSRLGEERRALPLACVVEAISPGRHPALPDSLHENRSPLLLAGSKEKGKRRCGAKLVRGGGHALPVEAPLGLVSEIERWASRVLFDDA